MPLYNRGVCYVLSSLFQYNNDTVCIAQRPNLVVDVVNHPARLCAVHTDVMVTVQHWVLRSILYAVIVAVTVHKSLLELQGVLTCSLKAFLVGPKLAPQLSAVHAKTRILRKIVIHTLELERNTRKRGAGTMAETPTTITEPIPVTVLSGFLGSGKTTLLKYILESPDHGLKIAVIVNDMAELSIDTTYLVHQSAVVQTEREVVTLKNGCICCTLRGDLIREIARIRKANEFNYVLIESTGIAEPQQVAEGFCFDPTTAELATSEEGMLWMQANLDTCVTVVDALNFSVHLNSLQHFCRFLQGRIG